MSRYSTTRAWARMAVGGLAALAVVAAVGATAAEAVPCFDVTAYYNTCDGVRDTQLQQDVEREVDAAADVDGIVDSKAPGCVPSLLAGRPVDCASRRGSDRDLPGEGYTFDMYFNCGVIEGQKDACFPPGTKNIDNREDHTWGWGSADYDGSGDVAVCVKGDGMGDCNPNLARACVYASCNDQDTGAMAIWVSHQHTHGHTVYGHGKA